MADTPEVPTPTAMPGLVAATEQPHPTTEQEHVCETLYIQNLNEKIKTDGRLETQCLVHHVEIFLKSQSLKLLSVVYLSPMVKFLMWSLTAICA